MAIEYRTDTCFQSLRRARRGKTEIEQDFHLAWNDVGGSGSAVDVRDLPRRGRKVFVAPVPLGCGELGEGRHREMDGILRKMRVGHVSLYASHAQRAGKRAAPAVLDGVAQPGNAGRLADEAVVDAFAAALQQLDHFRSPVDGGTFLV